MNEDSIYEFVVDGLTLHSSMCRFMPNGGPYHEQINCPIPKGTIFTFSRARNCDQSNRIYATIGTKKQSGYYDPDWHKNNAFIEWPKDKVDEYNAIERAKLQANNLRTHAAELLKQAEQIERSIK
jgi:hypothetical protein